MSRAVGGGGLSRRRLLGYLGSAAAGAAVTAPAYDLLTARDPEQPGSRAEGGDTATPHGEHQPGVATPAAPATDLVALDLRAGVGRDGLRRLLRLWTGDVEALSAGRPAPGDPAPGLAAAEVGMTITVALGPAALRAARIPAPPGFAPVPPMQHDALEERWSGGDLLVTVAAAEATTVAHAVRMLVRDAGPFARLRWRQSGSWKGTDAQGRPVTGRNLFDQVDGSGNPRAGTREFDRAVWLDSGPWRGGTTVVVRRIRMDLDRWDDLTRAEQEGAVGRDLVTGAPLTGGAEHHQLDLQSRRAGRLVIPADAHARRSHPSQNAGRRIFRKGHNYVDTIAEGRDTRMESGLIFTSYQADLEDQFVRIQQRLDEQDALNEWTTAIGSATFAVLPGFWPGGWLGDGLLDG